MAYKRAREIASEQSERANEQTNKQARAMAFNTLSHTFELEFKSSKQYTNKNKTS